MVATPNHLHEPHVLSVLARKMNVLCERPLALTVARSRADPGGGDARGPASRGRQQPSIPERRPGARALSSRGRARPSDRDSCRFVSRGASGRLARRDRAEAGGGVFLEHGLPLLDLALWLADFPAPERVTAHMDRARGAGAVEDSMFVHLQCAPALSCSLDVSWSYVGEEDRWWFEVLATQGECAAVPAACRQVTQRTADGRLTDWCGRARKRVSAIVSRRARALCRGAAGRDQVRSARRPGRCAARARSHLSGRRRQQRDQALSGSVSL